MSNVSKELDAKLDMLFEATKAECQAAETAYYNLIFEIEENPIFEDDKLQAKFMAKIREVPQLYSFDDIMEVAAEVEKGEEE